MRPVALLTLLALVSVLAAGCATAPSAGSPASAPAAKSDQDERRAAVAKLKKGMTAAQVRALLGAPDQVVPQQTAVGAVDAWIYRTKYTAGSRHIQTGSESYVRPNPLTGANETVVEPIMGVENTYVTEEHVLVMRKGRLFEWKSVAGQSKTIS